jgi:hypothetical protein
LNYRTPAEFARQASYGKDVGSAHFENAGWRLQLSHSFDSCWLSCKITVRRMGAGQLIDEKTGAHRFRDFLDDDKRMAYVFQFFVFNFLKIERPELRVRRENIGWQTGQVSETDRALLPIMQTDVSMDVGARHIILDTKFYRETLVEYHGSKEASHRTSLPAVQLPSEQKVREGCLRGYSALSNCRR